MSKYRNFLLITLIFPDDDVCVAYGDGGRAVVQTRLSVTWRCNSKTGKDDLVQTALEACIFCSSFPVWKMRPTVNPVVSFSAIELAGLARRRLAKYFEGANAYGRELLHHARKQVKMRSFDVLCRALMFILLTNTSGSTDSALCRKDFFVTYGNLLSGLSVV